MPPWHLACLIASLLLLGPSRAGGAGLAQPAGFPAGPVGGGGDSSRAARRATAVESPPVALAPDFLLRLPSGDSLGTGTPAGPTASADSLARVPAGDSLGTRTPGGPAASTDSLARVLAGDSLGTGTPGGPAASTDSLARVPAGDSLGTRTPGGPAAQSPRPAPPERSATGDTAGAAGGAPSAPVAPSSTALGGGSPPPARPVAAPLDSLRWHGEVGAGTDVSNEQFYEDAYLADTTFLGRRLVSTPEARFGAVVAGGLEGTRHEGDERFKLQADANLGDKLQRGALQAGWWDALSPLWRLGVMPRIEARHDLSFGRDLHQLRIGTNARLRRLLEDRDTWAELDLGGEILNTSGIGSEFLLDHRVVRAGFDVSHAGLAGPEWHAGYGLTEREFPDSLERDHLEHGWEGSWRWSSDAGHTLLVETEGARRVTLHPASTTRDRFWQGRVAVTLEVSPLETWSWAVVLEGEDLRYDQPDTTLDLDDHVLRVRLGPRWRQGGWSLAPEARAELGVTPRDPGEDYRETGAELAIERLGTREWWSLQPAAGWREYRPSDGTAGPLQPIGIHSSFAFYELTVFGDQRLPGALRFRASGAGRLERHTDRSQDSRSLYISAELRRLF